MRIGGITIDIESKIGDISLPAESAYREFTTMEPDTGNGLHRMTATLEPGNFPEQRGMHRIFDSGSSWSMFFDGENRFVTMKPLGFDQPIWMAKIGKDCTAVNVYCGNKLIERKGKEKTVSSPICYPLDQILVMYFLSMRSGALIHAAGAEIHGKGLIFPGKSGAGKSTLCRQIAGRSDVKLLSDDRMIVKKEGGRFVAYGTPWPGDAGIAENRQVPLNGLMFLKKGKKNRIKGITAGEALKKLIPVTSIPWYDRLAMEALLDLCDTLISDIPAHELEFVPDAGAADVICRFMREGA